MWSSTTGLLTPEFPSSLCKTTILLVKKGNIPQTCILGPFGIGLPEINHDSRLPSVEQANRCSQEVDPSHGKLHLENGHWKFVDLNYLPSYKMVIFYSYVNLI
jgi:hypothetical protein